MPYLPGKLIGNPPGVMPVATFTYDVKIARVQRTLRWLEEDASLLSLRVRDLSPERQKVAKSFAASMIDQTRAELDRLMRGTNAGERRGRSSLRTG